MTYRNTAAGGLALATAPTGSFESPACSVTAQILSRFSYWLVVGLLSGLLHPFALFARQVDAPGAADLPDPQAVQECIDRTISYIYTRQEGNSWPEYIGGPRYRGATTALAVLALVTAGENPKRPEILRALKYIEANPGEDNRSVYGISIRIMALVAVDPERKEYARIVDNDVKWLINNQTIVGTGLGGWGYDERSEYSDSSLSQFAVLALHEAAQAGCEVPEQTWKLAEKYWINAGGSQGGYSYHRGGASSGSMTCAGISSLAILKENLLDPNDFLRDGSVNCCQQIQPYPQALRAIQWMTNRFMVHSNPGGNTEHKFYYLYGLERAARLSGLRFFGSHDWYREGCNHLLRQQNREGAFGGGISGDFVDTCFALLFLSKGLRPILFGKYQYTEQSDAWDTHPAGVHLLTRETEKAWNIPMTWQTIRATDATANDLREAPILFLSGREALVLNEKQKSALRDYIENGGFLLAEALQGDGCGNDVAFDRTFRNLMKELFPESSLEPLSDSHPIWTANYQIKPDPDWPLLGLQACCRTSVVYCPRSLSCYWQLDRPALLSQIPRNVSAQVVELRKLGINIAAYATGRELLQRLSRPKLADRNLTVLGDRMLTYPKLIPDNFTDDAPHAWKNILREFSTATQFSIDDEKKKISINFDEMANFPFLFLHGREPIKFTAQQRADLKKYLETGNMLFVDSICSSDRFNKSFESELEQMFPGQLVDIPREHPIFSERFGNNLSSVELRIPDAKSPSGVRMEKTYPQMKGIEVDGRLVLVYSPFDISCAMENAAANQCRGYAKTDAARIAVNVMLYGLLVD